MASSLAHLQSQKPEGSLAAGLEEILDAEPPHPLAYISRWILAEASRLRAAHENEFGPRNEARRPSLSCGDALPQEESSGKWSPTSWLESAGVHGVVAGAIQTAVTDTGSSAAEEDVLAFLRGLKDRAALAKVLLTASMMEGLVDLVWREVQMLQSAGAATTTEVQSKFAGAVELSYSGLDTFFGGLEGVVGSPNPKLFEAMAAEHTNGPGTESSDQFVTNNYGVQTCSKAEWLYVVAAEATPAELNLERWPEESKDKLPDRDRCRQRRPLANIEEAAEARNQQLEQANQPPLVKEELIAANLYTGPVCTATRDTRLRPRLSHLPAAPTRRPPHHPGADVRQVQRRAPRPALRLALPQELDDHTLLPQGDRRWLHGRCQACQRRDLA
eukprot:4196501-Prymnesium_polylepis.2